MPTIKSSASNSNSITSNLTSTVGDGSGIYPQESATSPSKLTRKHMWINVKSKVRNTYLFLDNVNMRDMHLMRQVVHTSWAMV